MMYPKKLLLLYSLISLALYVTACTSSKQQDSDAANPESPQTLNEQLLTELVKQPATLPVKYQTASYIVKDTKFDDKALDEESKLKVGARITSTQGPQPLWDILKKLANLKDMNVSWASDVDRNVLVDVDIKPNDDFYQAIDNMLRQIDYYHEVQGSTIVVKYKETRQFQISMPFVKHLYNTKTGGDMLGGSSSDATTNNISGEIGLASEGVAIKNHSDGSAGQIEFNVWNSIENNLNAILNIWSTDEVEAKRKSESDQTDYVSNSNPDNAEIGTLISESVAQATYRRSHSGNTYFIDKPVGLITVTAPRPLMLRIDSYIRSLKRELYKQVSIEAKIIEVQLDDRSSIGINWNLLLQNLSLASGSLSYLDQYSKTRSDTTSASDSTSLSSGDSSSTSRLRSSDYDYTTGDYTSNSSSTSITDLVTDTIDSVASTASSTATIITDGFTRSAGATLSLASFTFDSFLNAVSEQGQTTILSNPKLSVLNGQPSLITVGKNVTYIDSISSDVDSETGIVTYTAETARALSGVGLSLTANILNDDEIILNIVPVTSELEEPIEYRTVGLGEVGLPIINVREMSTTIRVKNGDMLVIGGLISSTEASEDSFLPGTRNIPFFKYLFGYEEKVKKKRELIILLQPVII